MALLFYEDVPKRLQISVLSHWPQFQLNEHRTTVLKVWGSVKRDVDVTGNIKEEMVYSS